MKRILLIDTHSLLHTIKFSFAKTRLSNEGQSTFLIYGFLMKLKYLLGNTNADVCVFATDEEGSYRKDIFPEYQENRRNKKEDKKIERLNELALPQFDIIKKEVLPTIGFSNIFGAYGFEADDIIAKICKDHIDKEIIIVTTDNDLYQLLSPNVCIFKHWDNIYYTAADFYSEYGIEPKMWKRVKSYGGCLSDGVPGLPIPGSNRCIGQGYALKYVKGEMPKHYKAYQAFIAEENKPILRRNKILTILPLIGTPSFEIKPEKRLRKGLIKVSKKYNFQSILTDFETWAKDIKLR